MAINYNGLKKDITMFTHDMKLNDIELRNNLQNIGIELDIQSGHLFYGKNFTPIILNYELVFIRHGETFGNCGQSTNTGSINFELVNAGLKNNDNRIFQGNVDTAINQLTTYGKQQAENITKKLETNFLNHGWKPDIILVSPLTRALDTAMPFIKVNKLYDCYRIHSGIKEISFGSWENYRVSDIPKDNACHLFYLDQHALVKNSGINRNGLFQEGENFSELLLRTYHVLIDLNKECFSKKIIMFSHSMFGAACQILLGKGQTIENGQYLAFDGKRLNGTSYTLAHATPIAINFDPPCALVSNRL